MRFAFLMLALYNTRDIPAVLQMRTRVREKGEARMRSGGSRREP